jgi:hypothetical protein
MFEEELEKARQEIEIGRLMVKLDNYEYKELHLLSIATSRTINNKLKEHIDMLDKKLERWNNE